MTVVLIYNPSAHIMSNLDLYADSYVNAAVIGGGNYILGLHYIIDVEQRIINHDISTNTTFVRVAHN